MQSTSARDSALPPVGLSLSCFVAPQVMLSNWNETSSYSWTGTFAGTDVAQATIKIMRPTGSTGNLEAVQAICKRHNLPLVEDAAQAIGAEWKGRRAGSWGEIGCFSFFPSKNLGAFGDGGLVVSTQAALIHRRPADRLPLTPRGGFFVEQTLGHCGGARAWTLTPNSILAPCASETSRCTVGP
jgi:hypothetical protein